MHAQLKSKIKSALAAVGLSVARAPESGSLVIARADRDDHLVEDWFVNLPPATTCLTGPIYLYDCGHKQLDRLHEIALRKAAARVGAEVIKTDHIDGILDGPKPSAVMFQYSEIWSIRQGYSSALIEDARRIEEQAPGCVIVNHPASGLIMGDKAAANAALSALVPIPKMQAGAPSEEKLFVNEAVGTKAPTYVTNDISEIGDGTYVTSYIDSVHEFASKTYHVSLRLMAVGPELLMVFVRARDTSEGSASVHDADTPRSPALLRNFHERIVEPNIEQLRQMARALGERLGIGLYGHDVVPCAATGKMYLCEAGYKPYDITYPQRMASIADELPAHLSGLYNGEFYFRSALSLVSQVAERGRSLRMSSAS
jgi:hypothetical protein